MPRLIFFSRNFPPLIGGIEHLMHSVFLCVKEDYDVVIVGPRGSKGYADGAIKVYELPINIAGYLIVSFILVPYLVFRYKPAFVVGANGLMAPLVAILSKLSGSYSICFLHGLDIIVKSPLYRLIFIPFLRVIGSIIVNSRNTRVLALNAGIPEKAIEVIHPCVREPVSTVNMDVELSFDNTVAPVIVYAGRIVPRKGLLEFVQECAAWLQRKKYKLVVAGDVPFGQAGSRRDCYSLALRSAVERLELMDSVLFLGRVSDEQMASAFARATVHVMPLVETPGDVEGFGMVAVEAASYGVPTVAFDVGGVRDALHSEEYLIPPGNYAQFMKVVDSIVCSDVKSEELIEWAKGFSMQTFRPRLLGVLSQSCAVHTADR